MIHILADKYLYNIRSYLPENINLTLFDPHEGLPDSIKQANGLLVRTIIPINRQTLPEIPEHLRFVGTGSAGTDHVNISYLEKNSVAFTDAAGCNARSVAEYVATALLIWADKNNKKVSDLSFGIVGAGHTGSQVKRILEPLGCRTVAYDPPKELREIDFKSAQKKDLLSCDILSFHTPLTQNGDFATYHWLSESELENNEFQLIINASRGGVIDEQAVLKAMDDQEVDDIVIDVWEDEPDFHLDTAKKAFIKTPHIAGYSIQAKENASRIIADALLDHFNLEHPNRSIANQHRTLEKDISDFSSLSDLLIELHPIKEYEWKLQEIIDEHPQERGKKFNKLRAEFPLRNQFEYIYLPDSYFERYPVLEKLGFQNIQ